MGRGMREVGKRGRERRREMRRKKDGKKEGGRQRERDLLVFGIERRVGNVERQMRF